MLPVGMPVPSVSVITGPVNVVNVPVPPVTVVLAEILPPPLAVLTLAAAKAGLAVMRINAIRPYAIFKVSIILTLYAS